MIDIDNWMRELDEEDDLDIKNNENYQHQLFAEYVMRGTDHREERQELLRRYRAGEELMGEHGLRKELAAFDMSYFGRAYLPHYFVRKSPQFHEELDEIWSQGVMKGKNPLKEAKVISRMKGSRQVVAAPRGHAKSTNFTFKDSLHAMLYGYKHYILILSDSTEQAEGFLDDIKTELEDNGNILMDFGSLKGDKAWRSGVILTSTDIKAEAIGSGKKVRGRRHRNWRPDLIVLDDIENDENVNTPDQRRKLSNWFTKAVSKAGDTYTDIMYIGTILHYDSLLSNVLRNPRYKTRKYRAVIAEAVNTKLWEEWESIYTNLFNERHEEDLFDILLSTTLTCQDLVDVLFVASQQSSKLYLCHVPVNKLFPDLSSEGSQSCPLCFHFIPSPHICTVSYIQYSCYNVLKTERTY